MHNILHGVFEIQYLAFFSVFNWPDLCCSQTWFSCTEQLGMTSRICFAMRSINWLMRKDGGIACTPPAGILISSRHIGHLPWRRQIWKDPSCTSNLKPSSLASVATILCKQWRQTVWEHGRSFGVCSPASNKPVNFQLLLETTFAKTYRGRWSRSEMTRWSLHNWWRQFLQECCGRSAWIPAWCHE